MNEQERKEMEIKEKTPKEWGVGTIIGTNLCGQNRQLASLYEIRITFGHVSPT